MQIMIFSPVICLSDSFVALNGKEVLSFNIYWQQIHFGGITFY